MRNASNTARQSVEIAKLSSGSSIAIETLEKSYETIIKGIEETKAIQENNRIQRNEMCIIDSFLSACSAPSAKAPRPSITKFIQSI